MNGGQLAPLLLRAQLWLRRAGPVACAALLLIALGLAGWSWVWTQRAQQTAQQAHDSAAPALPVPTVLASAAPPASPAQNLALFYATLGELRDNEQQVKVLFDLAAKAGLSLNQGEYKSAYDQAGRVHTYQVLLPVKGSYAAVWRFTLDVLRVLPFAALDEISFRRDSIGENTLEARLRFTLYLKSRAP